MPIDGIPLRVQALFAEQSTDLDWLTFIVPVMNIASFDLPKDMRIGQKLMNALNERNQSMVAMVICDSRFDIWEVSDPDDPRIQAFADRVFDMFVESL